MLYWSLSLPAQERRKQEAGGLGSLQLTKNLPRHPKSLAPRNGTLPLFIKSRTRQSRSLLGGNELLM